MLRRLWLSMRRDNRINFRNHYYTVVVLVALIYLAALTWLVPENITSKPSTYMVDQTNGARVAAAAQRGPNAEQVRVFSTVTELRLALGENRNALGIVLEEGQPLPQVTLLFQGHESERVRNLAAVSIEAMLRQIYQQPLAGAVPVQMEPLRGDSAPPAIPLGKMLVPLFLISDAAMLGLLFIAALMFMEKEEGTLKAYMVTPGRVSEYLASKALTLALLAVLFTLILVPPVLGVGPNYLHTLALMVMASLFSSLVGALLAIYTDSLTQFLAPAIVLMVVLAIPTASLLAPSFSPLWVRLFPTYPLVFGLREALFPSGNPQVVYSALLTLLGVNAVLLAGATVLFRRQVVRT